jgi:hypothetical protein
VTPLPVKPAACAAGAPICGTLWSRETVRLPSSQIRSTPPAASTRAPDGPFVNACHTAPASAFAAVTAAPPIAGRSRVTRVPATWAPAGRASPFGYDTSSGNVSGLASS